MYLVGLGVLLFTGWSTHKVFELGHNRYLLAGHVTYFVGWGITGIVGWGISCTCICWLECMMDLLAGT